MNAILPMVGWAHGNEDATLAIVMPGPQGRREVDRRDRGVRSASPRHRALEALADVLVPPGGRLSPGAVEAGVPQRIVAALGTFPPRHRRMLGALIVVWDLAPLTHPRYLRRFHRLSPDKRRQWTEWLQHSRRRDLQTAFYLLKQLVFLFYASAPEVEEAIGFDYTCRRDAEAHGMPVRPQA